MATTNELQFREFNTIVQGEGQIVQENIDQFFTDGLIELDGLVWHAGGGDVSKEFRDFERHYERARGRQWVGPESLRMPDMIEKDDFARIYPQGRVFGPWDQKLMRLPNVPRPDGGSPELSERLRRQFAAVEVEVPLSLSALMREKLITDNAGHGGDQSWLKTNKDLPLFDLANKVFTSDKANVNIKTPTVSSVSNPTIEDARILMDAAQAHFLDIDAFRKGFVNTSILRDRGEMQVLTSSPGWDLAFQDLRDDERRSIDSTDPLSETGSKTNKWRGQFTHIHTTKEIGEAWENWVRIFAVGERPEDKPIVQADDIPLTSFAFAKELVISYGMVVSWYLDVWDATRAVLMKATE